MDSSKVIAALFDEKKLNVLKVFLTNTKKEYYLQQISQESKVPIATTYRIVNKLVEVEVIVYNKIGKFKIYRLNEHAGDLINVLNSMISKEKLGLLDFVKKFSNVKGVESVLLHGPDTEVKASVLILGEGFDTERIKLISGEAKEMHNYTLTYMLLSREQFEQMRGLNMIPGDLRILWEKK